MLERDVLRARVSGYEPSLLDQLGAGGEVAWFGAGRLGKDDGRVVLVRREMLEHYAPRTEPEVPTPAHEAIVAALRARGALFFTDLIAAAGAPVASVLEALWDLVWQGAVTNDTFAPLRALSWPRRGSGPAPRGRVGRLPPESAGRWSLVRTGQPGASASVQTARLHVVAQALLERHGVVTREGVNAEDLPGGFSSVYPVLKAMEDAGRVRRGYFVEGLGAAQFGYPGAVERLRGERDPSDEPGAVVLAACDPAQPYGAAVPWPRRSDDERRGLARAAGAQVVMVDGVPVLYAERSGRGIVTLPAAGAAAVRGQALGARLGPAARAGSKGFTIERIDGVPAIESPMAGDLRAVGFATGYRGLTYRPGRPGGSRSA